MKKIPKREYTAEFKDQAVKRAQAVGAGPAAKELGMVEQTLRNWFKASQAGTLAGAGSKTGDTRADGDFAAASGVGAGEHAGGHLKKSDGVLRQGCAVKYAWMQLERRQFPLQEMCSVLWRW
jgi:transposase